MTYSVSTIAMIIFFACVAIAGAIGSGPVIATITWIAAAVAAIALALRN